MRTLLLTCLCLIATCWCTSATAQTTNPKSDAVRNQISVNANTGADEYNRISLLYRFLFSDVIANDQAEAIDGKLQTLYPEIRSVKTSPGSTHTEMLVEVDPMLSYEEVKTMVARFGYNLTDIQKEYIVATK
jgi:predicted exporter